MKLTFLFIYVSCRIILNMMSSMVLIGLQSLDQKAISGTLDLHCVFYFRLMKSNLGVVSHVI